MRIGFHLFQILISAWIDYFTDPLQFITNSVNFTGHHFAEKCGFQKVGDYSHFGSDILNDKSNEPIAVMLNESLEFE
jgi:hypothetical protein